MTPVKILFAVLVLVMAKDCDIDVGNLGDFVVTYDIAVTNNDSAEAAVVTLRGSDINRSAVLQPGKSVSVSSFAGGNILVVVSPAVDYVAQLKARRDALAAELDKKPLDLAKSLSIYNNLNAIQQEIRSYESRGHGSLCGLTLKPNPDGKGTNHHLTATLEGDKWSLTCE